MANRTKTKRDVLRTVKRREFISKLRKLADALETGERMILQVRGERIRVPRDAEMSIEHEREDGEEELEFQLRWRTGN
jgi:amphi-Trp domain-containing protein